MPELTARKRPAVSLVQDQDIVLTIEAGLSDLIITIIGAVDEDGVKHVTDLLVSLNICTKSPYLKAVLEANEDKTEITFGGDAKSDYDGENKEGTLIWLAHLHELPEQRLEELGLFKVSLVGVRHAISLWDTHQEGKIKETLGSWFNKWYEKNMAKIDLTVPTARALAYPCYIFDHAVGYARVTMYLAYEHVGHVKERPPKGSKGPKHLHINERMFVGPLNHTRGGLRNSLHKSLYSRVGRILRSETSLCSCWDDEYEKHNQSVGGRWDTKCRIEHGHPTWYISWLGRPDLREKILRCPDGYRAPEED